VENGKTASPSAILSPGRRWALGFALFTALLTTIPYLAAFANQGGDWVFSGFLFGVDDGNSYVAKMLAGANGAWLFRTPYTVFPQNGIFAFLPYILLGKLAAPPELHLQLVLLFHFFRLAAVVACVWAIHDFIARFVPGERLQRLGTILGVFGGGLGWLLPLFGQSSWLGSLPLDFFSPETFGFLALLGVPHLAAGRALLFWGLLAYLDGAGWRAGIWWLLASLFNPLVIPIGGLVIGVHWLISRALRLETARADFRTALQAGLVVSPMVAYLLWQSAFDPFLKAWTAQNTILSPNPLHYLLAYGLLLPWAALGAWQTFKRKDRSLLLITGWALLLPLLAYIPYNLQRRLPEGIFIALIALAFAGLAREEREVRRWKLAPFILLFPSTLLLLAGTWTAANHPNAPVFIPRGYVAAFEYLADRAQAGEVVLAGKESSNALPAFAPLKVVIGHGPETIGFSELLPQVEAFYGSRMDPSKREMFLGDQGVDYIIRGPWEALLGDWDGTLERGWSAVYNQSGILIFARTP
jgi:hypothetical protein